MQALLLLALFPGLALAAPVTYPLDPERSELVALTHPAGFLSGVSHAHAIAARDLSGEVVYDAEAPEHSRVEVRLPTASLENDDPALRERFHLGGTLSEGDRRKVSESMRSRGQLDVERYPEISFTSSEVRRLEDGRLEVTGLLRLHGVAGRINVPVRVWVEGEVLRGEGSVRISQRAYGIEPFSTGLGTVRNADPIELRIALVGRAAPPLPTGTGRAPAEEESP